MKDVMSKLVAMDAAPADKKEFSNWLGLSDAIEFLKDQLRNDEVVLYAGFPHTFIHLVLVPNGVLDPLDVDDLISWSCNASSSWGVGYVLSEPASASIEPPLGDTGSKILDHGEQLVFARFFEGRLEDRSYFEILQKMIHVLDLHYLSERAAYCRLDEFGDVEDVIRIVKSELSTVDFNGSLVTIRRVEFEKYMALTDSSAVQMFDITRFSFDSFSGWGNHPIPNPTTEGGLTYRLVLEPGYASYLRGFHIMRPSLTSSEMAARFVKGDARRLHESFIAFDWKNNVVREISCGPGGTANYFTASDLPFEISPAFFRPEVLLKYKADSEKYTLRNNSISCRGSWHLQTYDINEYGQVHTYIRYLSQLPYEEQRYWKAFNEAPKGPISERAFKSDFEGNWDIQVDPLSSIKAIVGKFKQKGVPWWTLRSPKLVDQVNYPVTSSPDEWADEILRLDQLIVEGFEQKYLRGESKDLGRVPAVQAGSLTLVEECLSGLGFEDTRAKEIVKPLKELHFLRSKVKGHASGHEAVKIKRDLLAKRGSYKQQFYALCGECEESLRTINEAFAAFK